MQEDMPSSRLLFRANTEEAPKGEAIMKTAINEGEQVSVALNSALTFSESLGSQARCLQGQPICSQWMNNSIDKQILLLMVCQGQILRIRKGSRYWWLLKEGTKEVSAQRTTLCWIWGQGQPKISSLSEIQTMLSFTVPWTQQGLGGFQFLQVFKVSARSKRSAGKCEVEWKLTQLFSLFFRKSENY